MIYTRVSRDDTGEGRSNQRQEEACRALCTLRGWDVVGVREDISISAYSGAERPGWDGVLEAIERGEVDVVVAWHLDRMTRSMLDLEHLILLADAHEVGVATAVGDIDLTTDVGRMVARIIAAVARAEVERKSARQKLANRQRAASGQSFMSGPRPFGYEEDRLTVREDEAAAFRKAVDMVLDGTPLAEIAQWLREQQFELEPEREVDGELVPAKIRKWSAPGVRRMVLAPRYVGISTYLGEPAGDGGWPALMDKETRLKVSTMLSDPGRRMNAAIGRGPIPQSLLTGIAYCWRCDATAKIGRSKVTGGERVPAYRCGAKSCFLIPKQEADDWVLAQIVGMLVEGRVSTRRAPDVDSARGEIDSLLERQKALAQAMAGGDINVDVWKAANEPLKARLAELEAFVTVTPIEGLSGDPRRVAEEIATLPLGRQRAIVEELLDVRMIGGVVTGRGKVHISARVDVTERKRE